MFNIWLLLLAGPSLAKAVGVELLFPELKRYHYAVSTVVSTETVGGASVWSLDGRLNLLVYENFTRIRLQLEDLKPNVLSQNGGYSEEAAHHLQRPWEVEYGEDGTIISVYVSEDPTWSINMKRALAVNLQIKTRIDSGVFSEPCLHGSCLMMYLSRGGTVKKYTTDTRKTNDKSWSSVPWSTDYRGYILDNSETAERTYEIGDKGLDSLVMNSTLLYKIDSHILSVATKLSLNHESYGPGESVNKLNLTRTGVEYTGDPKDYTSGIRPVLQSGLRNRTYEILLKIATKGIDADNIVRNGSYIHSLTFVELLDTISRLSYVTLTKLFEDLVLGTSYDLETARNIFLEVLPHARSDACARFIKHLVIEEKDKLEDATILSMIRKLPFNVANLSQNLLEELETFTKLGLDFPPSIRHAGILSFAILVSKAAEASEVKQDFFDNIVVKYFRMYSDCPQYQDRMVWLQGLCSLGYTAESYIRTIYGDKSRNRHERLWASLACAQDKTGYSVLESYLPILTDESEHIQLRIAALHSILSTDIRARDFLFLHNFIMSSNCNNLKRFWYSTVKSLQSNKYFSEYKYASYYVPFVSKHVKNPDTTYWATNNYIVSSDEDLGAWVQLMSVGGEPVPTFGGLRVSTPGRRPFQAAVYMITEGVSSNIFKKMYKLTTKGSHVENIVNVLEKMKVRLRAQEEVHIDIVIKIHDKTVFATHVNQTRFESWNGDHITKSLMEFLRFGSHINQQIVYYPVQLDVNLYSELGTPIRLQSSVVTFTSVRGNLTAPPELKQDLDWENDLHIRYQGTTVTTLSTLAPLLQSEHRVRLQRSFVAHLPIKFNVTVEKSSKSMALTWLNPFAQRAGMAMHSRVLMEVDSPSGRDKYTLSRHNNDVEDHGIFFDCERKISGGEVVEKYFLSKFVSYDILPTHQSILNNLERFLSSPACGVIVPASRPAPAEDEVVEVKFNLGNISWTSIDKIELNFGCTLSYYSLAGGKDGIFLKMDSTTMLRSAGGNMTVLWNVLTEQSYGNHPDHTYHKICFSLEDVSQASEAQDIAIYPAAYRGRGTVTFSTSADFQDCTNLDNTSRVTMLYTGRPTSVNGDVERYMEVNIIGENLHKFGVWSHIDLGDGTPVTQLLGSFDKDTINSTAVIKEKHGVGSVSVNNGAEIQFELENFGWLLDSLTSMQLMKRFGVYRECRIQKTSIQTLTGNVEPLQPLQNAESLVLGDCSEAPSFAILRNGNGRVIIYDMNSNINDTQADQRSSLPVPRGSRFLSSATGIIIYSMANETVVLVPSPYMPHVCGECVSNDNKYC